MNADAGSADPPAVKLPRGRPVAESPQQRIERLQAELRQAEADLAAANEQRALITGKAVIAHARKHDAFRQQLADALRAEVKNKTDRAAIAELLIEPDRR